MRDDAGLPGQDALDDIFRCIVTSVEHRADRATTGAHEGDQDSQGVSGMELAPRFNRDSRALPTVASGLAHRTDLAFLEVPTEDRVLLSNSRRDR